MWQKKLKAELESVPTADPPSIPPTDQPQATLTAQSENVTPADLGSSLALPTEQIEKKAVQRE